MTDLPSQAEVFGDSTLFARVFLKILNKDGELVPLAYNSVQRDFLSHWSKRELVLKARQMGISTAIQAEFFRLEVTKTAITVTLSHEDDTTQRFRRMVDRFYDNMPEGFRPQRRYNNSRLSSYPDFDSEAIIATAGNKQTGRGGTSTYIHGSEVAFWTDAESLMAGLMQGGNPTIILESTPNGAQGYFYEKCMEARDGNSDWTLRFYPWWHYPEYRIPLKPDEKLVFTSDELRLMELHSLSAEQIRWRRSKQRELKDLFPQEYPEDALTCFLLSGRGYFGDVSAAYTALMAPIYDSTHRYVAGVDWGQSIDYTAMPVLDMTTRQQVDLLHVNNLEWQEIRRRIIAMCKKWNVRSLVAEKNSASTNIESLQKEMAAAGVRCAVTAFDTTNESKASVCGALHESLHSVDGLKLMDIAEQKHELQAFAARQLPSGAWKLEAPAPSHDDIIIGLALALNAGSVGMSDEDMAAIGTNKIDITRLAPALIEAMRASGVDVDALMKQV